MSSLLSILLFEIYSTTTHIDDVDSYLSIDWINRNPLSKFLRRLELQAQGRTTAHALASPDGEINMTCKVMLPPLGSIYDDVEARHR